MPFHIASLLPQLLNTAPQQLSHPSPPAAGSANPKLQPGRYWSSLDSSDLIPISWTALPSPEQHHWVSPAAWVPPHLTSLPGRVLVSPFPGCSASLPTTLVPPYKPPHLAQPVPHAPRMLPQGKTATHHHLGPLCPGQEPFIREYLHAVSSKVLVCALGQAPLYRVGCALEMTCRGQRVLTR